MDYYVLSKAQRQQYETYEQFELVARAWAVVKMLAVGRFVCHLTGTVVIILKVLVKVDDDFQV